MRRVTAQTSRTPWPTTAHSEPNSVRTTFPPFFVAEGPRHGVPVFPTGLLFLPVVQLRLASTLPSGPLPPLLPVGLLPPRALCFDYTGGAAKYLKSGAPFPPTLAPSHVPLRRRASASASGPSTPNSPTRGKILYPPPNRRGFLCPGSTPPASLLLLLLRLRRGRGVPHTGEPLPPRPSPVPTPESSRPTQRRGIPPPLLGDSSHRSAFCRLFWKGSSPATGPFVPDSGGGLYQLQVL